MNKEYIISLNMITLMSIAGACAATEHCKECPYLIKEGKDCYCFFHGSNSHDGYFPENWDFSKINWEVGDND